MTAEPMTYVVYQDGRPLHYTPLLWQQVATYVCIHDLGKMKGQRLTLIPGVAVMGFSRGPWPAAEDVFA